MDRLHEGRLHKGDKHYDVLFQRPNHTFSERRRALTPNGICLNVGLAAPDARDTALHLVRIIHYSVHVEVHHQKFKFFIAN